MYPRKNTTLLRFGLTATRPTRLRTRPQRRTPGPNIKHVGHRAVELCPREPGGRGGSHFKSSYHPPSPPPPITICFRVRTSLLEQNQLQRSLRRLLDKTRPRNLLALFFFFYGEQIRLHCNFPSLATFRLFLPSVAPEKNPFGGEFCQIS